MYKKWKQSQATKEEYKQKARNCRNNIRKANMGNELRIARDVENKKAFFRYIQNQRHQEEKGVQLLKVDGRVRTDDKEKAEALNSYFTSVFSYKEIYSQEEVQVEKQIWVQATKISNTWLSTGWFTMSIALELCDRIDVYGMVPSDFCRDTNHPFVPYHYYEPLGPDECTMYVSHERGRKGSHHRFITEKRVFENWARTFNIHFFQPDWKPETLPLNQANIKLVF
ncbi:Alpha-N-acetylgalactosaminide alpha-2,6-sialyltransferase 5 [Varanus komodoensis]|nr:Alpha-N-acetylgalactosaminide alpha-2,6-sialyltransferase 5 [Varanus komodoensis]